MLSWVLLLADVCLENAKTMSRNFGELKRKKKYFLLKDGGTECSTISQSRYTH